MPTEYITNPLSIVTDALDVVGDSVKALTRRKVSFPEYNNGTGYGLPYVDLRGDAYGGYGTGSPGAAHDYAGMAGDLLQCSAVAACIQAKSTALADAPPILEERKGDQWEKVAEHPIIDLLMAPNPYHGYSDLWGATCAAEDTTGQAFWRLEFDKSGTPAEIWTEHPDRFRIVGRGGEYISHYVYSPLQGQPIELEDKAIVHFRRGLNLHNGRVGWTPLSAGHRQVAGDNGAATYHSAILRNSGVMSLLISIKEGQAVGNGLSQPQMQEFVTGIKRKLFGEGAGGIVGLNLPLSVDKMSYSPDEMSLDSLISYYETRICALIGVDPMVVGLGSGTTQKTYANFKEAINDFWERCVLPTKSRHAATLNTQLLPLFGLDPAKFRISWDYTNIAALAENKDEIHTRAREDYKAGVIDLDQARVMMGYESEEQYKGKFFAAPPAPEEVEAEDEEAAAVEAKAWAFKKYDPRQPRDDLGRWTDSATGRLSVGHALHVMKSEGIHDEAHHKAVKEAIESGKHKTREDVLKHIDSIHAKSKGAARAAESKPMLFEPSKEEMSVRLVKSGNRDAEHTERHDAAVRMKDGENTGDAQTRVLAGMARDRIKKVPLLTAEDKKLIDAIPDWRLAAFGGGTITINAPREAVDRASIEREYGVSQYAPMPEMEMRGVTEGLNIRLSPTATNDTFLHELGHLLGYEVASESVFNPASGREVILRGLEKDGVKVPKARKSLDVTDEEHPWTDAELEQYTE